MIKRMHINEEFDNNIESTYDEYVNALDDLRDYIDNMSRHLRKYNKDIKNGFDDMNKQGEDVLISMLKASIKNMNKIYNLSITDPMAIYSFVNKSK